MSSAQVIELPIASPRPVAIRHRGRVLHLADLDALQDHLAVLADESQARAETVERAFQQLAFDAAPPLARLHFTLAAKLGALAVGIANAVRGQRWPRDPRIDLRAVDGFANNGPPAVGYLALRRRGVSRQTDQLIAGCMVLAAALAGSVFLFAPDQLIAAVLG
jgi:hypothetical protein